MMIDVDTVIDSFSLKPQNFKLDKDDTSKLNELVEEYISQSQDLIYRYTNNSTILEDTPKSVQNVCLRLVANMIGFIIQRRDSPIIKVNDWQIKTINSEIFTDDLKRDLAPFVIEHSITSDTIDFFAITGGDELYGSSSNNRQ